MSHKYLQEQEEETGGLDTDMDELDDLDEDTDIDYDSEEDTNYGLTFNKKEENVEQMGHQFAMDYSMDQKDQFLRNLEDQINKKKTNNV